MLNKKAGLLAVLFCLSLGDVFAGTLASYSIGDVLLCFRRVGSTNDMVVDLGPVSTFTNAAPNQRISLNAYNGSQLAMIGTNSINWSVFTYFDLTVTPADIQWTLFASLPRSSLNTQTTPIIAYKASSQHQAANEMADIPPGAKYYYVTTNYSPLNTATAVLEPDNNAAPNYQFGQSYSFTIGYPNDLNFQDTLQAYPENTTPANFTTAGTVQRSDFYWLHPANDNFSTPGIYLGYFELNTNGVMSYVAYPSAAPAIPVIQSITRTNTVTYVTFTTGSSGTYTLRATNVLNSGAAGTWPAISSGPGTGSLVTLRDTNSAAARFYLISAQ